jgi:hypothetical protein
MRSFLCVTSNVLGCFLFLFFSPIAVETQTIRVPTPVERVPAKPKVSSSPPGLVHIYQINGGMGPATIYLDGEAIADLRERRYFIIRVKPGPHSFHVSKHDQGELRLAVEGRRSYYVKNTGAFWSGREKLKLMDVGTGEAELRRCKLLEGKDVIKHSLFVKPEMSKKN